jgi:hypothetical protein
VTPPGNQAANGENKHQSKYREKPVYSTQTLRHGMSIELEQSLRCLDTGDTIMAMEEYIRYINKNILTSDMSKAKTKDIVDLVKKTTDTLEKAEIFREFQGK